MEAIKFTLSGIGATFKRPYINTINLTYSNIHKVALLGMFGAILGLKGHRHKEVDELFPEFYEKLKGLKIAIVPHKNCFFQRDTKCFSETTGFFNDRETLLVKEQFLIQPSWEIYVVQGATESQIYESLKYSLLNKESVFEPFLGKNHYPAEIKNVEIKHVHELEELYEIHSLFSCHEIETEEPLDADKEYFCLKEFMPIRFTPYLNHYHEEELCLTNYPVVLYSDKSIIYTDGQYNLYFM